MNNKEDLISYIKTLSQEQAADAKEFIYSWLSKQSEAALHPLRRECEQAQ